MHQTDVIKKYGAESIIDQLNPFLSPERKNKIETILEGRLKSVQLALEAPADIHNALATIRSSEVFGTTTTHFIQAQENLINQDAITKGAFHWIDLFFHANLEDFIKQQKENNWIIAGGTICASTKLSELPIDKPLCILLGNERFGLSQKAKDLCDILYQIPMHGMTESLNLSVSAAVSLYDITQRKRQWLNSAGDLNPTEKLNTRAYYYLKSVDPRFALNMKFLS